MMRLSARSPSDAREQDSSYGVSPSIGTTCRTRRTTRWPTARRMGDGVSYRRTTLTFLPPPRRARMELLVHLAQALPRDLRVDLRGRDVDVPEHRLHRAEIRTSFDEM